MIKNILKYLNRIFFAMSVLALSGCYTVLLHESARVEDNESEPAESDRAYEDVAFQDVRWVVYYDGAAPWWQDDSAYEISDDPSADGSSATHRWYGRRREALKEDNTSGGTGLFYSPGSAVLPSSISTNPAAAANSDPNKSQNTNSSGSNNQAAKSNSESQNTQRHYGARENAKKK